MSDDEGEKKKEEEEEQRNAFNLAAGIVSMRLNGKLLGMFLPYLGTALVILVTAYAITWIIQELRQ